MSLNKSYAVFGLGQYGLAVAKELVSSGADVLAVDIDEKKVNLASVDIPLCRCADITDSETLKILGIANIDTVIIAMANNLESSVLAVMLCKEAGVQTVIVKCYEEIHARILKKVGADKIVYPESESGIRLAKNLLSSGFIDVIELANGVSMIELDVKSEWVGKSLIELNLRKKYSLNIVAIKRGESVRVDIDPTEKLTLDMKLIVIANSSKLSKLK